MTRRIVAHAALFAATVLLGACANRAPLHESARSPDQVRAQIVHMLPAKTTDREGWATDIYAAFSALGIEPTTSNLCATVAVTDQESNFSANPAIPGLGKIARAEIEHRAGQHHIPLLLVNAALRVDSSTGKSYGERIAAARTEQDLSRIYEDLIASVPLGRQLFADANPVRTAGAMQVSVAFAEQQAREHPYPYPIDGSIRHEVFTRHGGMYFGIAHLLDYRAPYERPLYRFADFNAGRYASRNAAFQNAISVASGIPLALDGDLVDHADDAQKAGATELAARSLARRLDLSEGQIRDALEQGRSSAFEKTELYRRAFVLAQAAQQGPLPRAVVPHIVLKGPKITRKLTTAWYAGRVDDRYRSCMAKESARAPTNRSAQRY